MCLAACLVEPGRNGPALALTGGCFQNRLLSESLARRIAATGLTQIRHRVVTPGDGGLAVGQAAAAAARIATPGESPGVSLSTCDG